MNWETNRTENPFDKMPEINVNFKMIALVGFLLALLVGGYSSFYTVEPDEEAVIIRLGKYKDTYPPGLHFKLPWGMDRLIKVKTKLIHQEEFGFRTLNTGTKVTTYSSRNFDNESSMLTGDLNVADVEWVVHFQIADPFKFIFRTSSPLKILEIFQNL